MYFYIKEWPNKSATLMAENGTVLWTFHNIEEARNVCREWYKAQEDDINYELHYLDDPGCSCVSMG
jgi:hypothetical protein